MTTHMINEIKLARTLYQNVYTARLYEEGQNEKGRLRIFPVLPLDRKLIPADAPSKPAYLLVLVEDAAVDKDNLLDFEEQVSLLLLKRFSTPQMNFSFCQFFYPSPAFVFTGQPEASI